MGESNIEFLSLLKASNPSGNTISDTVKPPDGSKGRILTAHTFNLKQQNKLDSSIENVEDEVQVLMPSGEIKRPLHIKLADVKLILPLEVRNAIVGVYMHMLSAFTGPPRSATAKKEKITDAIPPEHLQEKREDEQQKRTSINVNFLRGSLLRAHINGFRIIACSASAKRRRTWFRNGYKT